MSILISINTIKIYTCGTLETRMKLQYNIALCLGTIIYSITRVLNMSSIKNNLTIGKAKFLDLWKGVNKLPVEYYAKCNAWITPVVCNEWLIKCVNVLDQDIVLLVDSYTARSVVKNLLKVLYAPANTTLRQGIIRTLKLYNRFS